MMEERASNGMNLLLVDDEEIILETLSDILEFKGFNVETARYGADALEIVKQGTVRVVLIDILLPDMDGIDLLKKIKDISQDIICIMITGNTSLEKAVEAMKDNADGYFLKPINVDDVVEKINDLVERQTLRRKLRESKERFRTIAEESLVGLIIVQDNHITYANKAIADILLEDPGNLSGMSVGEFFAYFKGSDRQKMENAWREINGNMAGGFVKEHPAKENGENLYRLEPRPGVTRWIEILLKRITLNGKNAVMFVLGDATARVVAQKELENLNQTLEARIRERTRELEEANRAKSDFLANMSHELRTPLNSIIGFSEALLKGYAGSLSEMQQEFVNDILESGLNLLDLVNEVLDLSRIEAGKMELILEKIEVEPFISKTMTMFREKARKKNIKIDMSIQDGLKTFVADKIKVREILFNFLDNALKFTDNGGDVGIRVSQTPDHVKFTVWDTGIGIAEKDMPRLFKPFEQLETALEKKVQGTGLGLHYSKRLAELHGGRIEVESQEGKGSSFHLLIPRHLEARLTPGAGNVTESRDEKRD